MYLVIELQKINNSQVANIVSAYENINVAEQKYHSVLSAAAVSTLPCNSCVMLDESGRTIKGPESYRHEVTNNE